MHSPTSGPGSTAPTTAQLSLIRMAMLGGVLLFGAIAWWARRNDPAPAATAAMRNILGVAPLALGIVALSTVVLLRRALARETDPARQATLRIIGWATGETAALAGGVGYFLTGDASTYFIGLAVLMFTFVGLPVPERR